MIPPLLQLVQGQRPRQFPVFPVRAMLGEKEYESVLKLMLDHGYFALEQKGALDSEGSDHFIMLKAGAENDLMENLVRGLWRLWRWGGGRRWMNTSEENEEYRRVLESMNSRKQGKREAVVSPQEDDDPGKGDSQGVIRINPRKTTTRQESE